MEKENFDIGLFERAVDTALTHGGTTHGLRRALRHLSKEMVLFRNHQKGLSDRDGKILIPTEDKVQIGGGVHTLCGFMNIDIVPPADLVCDVREGIPLGDASVRTIFTEHFFEHIDYPISAKFFVSECHRILIDDGELILGVPDGEQIAKAYMERDQDVFVETKKRWYSKRNCQKDINTYIDLLNYHFRDQDDDPKYNPHYWAYDFEKLESLLKNAGFSSIERWTFNPLIANSKRGFGSIYVRAVK